MNRDVKPANIFVTSRGQAKMLDFRPSETEREPSEISKEQLETLGFCAVGAHLLYATLQQGSESP